MSSCDLGVKTPLTSENVQSKPLLAEVSLVARPRKPARSTDAMLVRLNVCFVNAGKTRHIVKAAICVWYKDLRNLLAGRHFVVIKEGSDGLYATHIQANGMHIPLLPS